MKYIISILLIGFLSGNSFGFDVNCVVPNASTFEGIPETARIKINVKQLTAQQVLMHLSMKATERYQQLNSSCQLMQLNSTGKLNDEECRKFYKSDQSDFESKRDGFEKAMCACNKAVEKNKSAELYSECADVAMNTLLGKSHKAPQTGDGSTKTSKGIK